MAKVHFKRISAGIYVKFLLVLGLNSAIWIFFGPNAQNFQSREIEPRHNESVDSNTFGELLKRTNFKFLITKPKCTFRWDSSYNTTLPFFITLVHSNPSSIELRNLARGTWAHSDGRTKTYFLLGKADSAEVQKSIDSENEEYDDIIQGNFDDVPRNQATKHFMGLKWFSTHCAGAKYLVRVDNNVFVNMPNVFNFLIAKNETKEFLMGNFVAAARVVRNGPRAITFEEYPSDFLPNYVNQSAIIYSNDVAIDLYEKSITSRYLWVEDAFITGLVRSQLNVGITNLVPYIIKTTHIRFMKGNSEYMPNPGNFMFSEPTVTIEDQRFIWDRTEWNRLNINMKRD